MLKNVLFVIFFLFSVIGISDFLYGIQSFFKKPKHKPATYLVVFLNGQDCELQLTYAAEKLLWYGSDLADGIIAIEKDLEFEDSLRCIEIAKKYDIIYFSKNDDSLELEDCVEIKNL